MAVAIPMPIRPGPTTPTVWLSIFCSSMLVPRIHAFCLGLVRLESCLKKRRQLLCGHARQTQTLERPARHPEIFIKDGTHQGQYAVGYWCRHPIELTHGREEGEIHADVFWYLAAVIAQLLVPIATLDDIVTAPPPIHPFPISLGLVVSSDGVVGRCEAEGVAQSYTFSIQRQDE